MPEDRRTFTYWAVHCKTPDCKSWILLCSIGSAQEFHHYVLHFCRPFRETCSGCGKENRYLYRDVEVQNYAAPDPTTYAPSRAFLEATTPPKERPVSASAC